MAVEPECDDQVEELNGWHLAKAVVIRQGQGAIMQLAGRRQKAWLPQEQIRPLVGPSEQEILEALGKPVKLWLDTSSLHTGLPVASMWRRDEESSEAESSEAEANVSLKGRTKEERLSNLRQNYDPKQWIQGTVASVKPFGIFVDIFKDIQVLVYIHSIPEEMVERLPGGPRAGDKVPDVEKGDEVELRVCGYRGKDRKGQDLFVCSMLPPSMDQPEKGRVKGEKGEKGKGKGKDGKGKRKDGKGGKGKEVSGYSVWVPDRYLESETTLARQEQFEVNALNAQLVEEQYGQGDRRAALARKGFTVVDYATSLQLSQVFKAKSEPKPDAETAMPITMPVWLTFQGRRKLIGKIQAFASMTTSEKERLAVDLAMTEYSDVIQAGANVQKVDVNFDRVLIRLFADAGIQF